MEERIDIRGYGRVGSKASAIRGGYSRARRYWQVVKWNGAKVDPSNRFSPLIGYQPMDDLGFFRTGKLAAAAAKAYAEQAGAELESYAASFLEAAQ